MHLTKSNSNCEQMCLDVNVFFDLWRRHNGFDNTKFVCELCFTFTIRYKYFLKVIIVFANCVLIEHQY